MTDMAGKVIVITGGNTGIGKEAAVALAGRGARVVVTSRNEERGRSARQEIAERSGNDSVDVMPLDLASFDLLYAFIHLYLCSDWRSSKSRPRRAPLCAPDDTTTTRAGALVRNRSSNRSVSRK